MTVLDEIKQVLSDIRELVKGSGGGSSVSAPGGAFAGGGGGNDGGGEWTGHLNKLTQNLFNQNGKGLSRTLGDIGKQAFKQASQSFGEGEGAATLATGAEGVVGEAGVGAAVAGGEAGAAGAGAGAAGAGAAGLGAAGAATGGIALVVAAAAAAATAIITLPPLFAKLGESVLETSKDLVEASGQISAIFAQQEAFDIQHKARIGAGTAETTGDLAESLQSLERTLEPMTIFLKNLTNVATTALVKIGDWIAGFLAPMFEGLNEIVLWLKKLFNLGEKEQHNQLPWNQALSDIGSGSWLTNR